MLNIEASIARFVNTNYIKKYRIFILFITKKINLKLIDDFIEYTLTKIIIIKIRLNDYVNKTLCLIVSLKKFDVILNML